MCEVSAETSLLGFAEPMPKIMKCAALNNFSASRVQKPNLFGYAEAMPEIMSEANN